MSIHIRLVENEDYYRGHLELLAQLTKAPHIEHRKYCEQLENIRNQHGYIYVLIDLDNNRIVGSITLLIEHKLIRNCGKVGHIEDVIVDKSYRGQGLGKKLIDHIKLEAEHKGCYKVILDCNENNCKFYQKCGLHQKETQMVKYFNS